MGFQPGKSSRTLSNVYSDLQAPDMLVIYYDYPRKAKADEIVDFFLLRLDY
jgi:hypothetical protein